MTRTAPVRASGKTTADEIAAEETKNGLELVQFDGDPVDGGLTGGAVAHPENVYLSLTPAFSRLRTDWNSPDREVMAQMRRGVELMVQQHFGDVYDLFFDIYLIVREPVLDPATGEIQTDGLGLPVWQRQAGTNSYVEDWSKIGTREREQFLYRITTGLFRWEQRAADLWGEAMFSRAQFEEAFAHGYESLTVEKATIEDHTARARALSAEYRYHAVYCSYLSRRADAVVRAVERLGQRLKDLMVN